MRVMKPICVVASDMIRGNEPAVPKILIDPIRQGLKLQGPPSESRQSKSPPRNGSKSGGSSPLPCVTSARRSETTEKLDSSILQEKEEKTCHVVTLSMPGNLNVAASHSNPISTEENTNLESVISSVEYKKAQFRKAALAKSYAFKGLPVNIRETDQGAVDTELNTDKLSEVGSKSPLEAVSFRLQPIIRRLPRTSLIHQNSHLYQVFQRFYIHHSEEECNDQAAPRVPLSNLDVDPHLLCSHGTFDDFQPSSFGSILQFCELLDAALNRDPNRIVALRCAAEQRSVTGAAFLAGAYMIFKLRSPSDEVERVLEPLVAAHRAAAAPRDAPAAALGVPATRLRLRDCWAGLSRAHELGWIDAGRPRGLDAGARGRDRDPMAPDVQELVPGRLVVLRGPQAIPGGQLWRDVTTGDGRPVERCFSPAFHAPGLRRLGVVAVVRLNAAEYPADAFPAEGLAFADLPSPAGGPPPPDVAAKLLRILDSAPGAVAVHGGASLGRAAAAAALYAMRRHGFAAREAAGWLQAVRPGSLADPRLLEYLVGREPVLRRASVAGEDPTAGPWGGSGVALAAGLGGSFGRRAPPQGGFAPRAPHAPKGHEPPAACEADPAEVARLVAEAIAEVDDRLRSLKAAGTPRRESGSAGNVTGAPAGGKTASQLGSFAVAATRAAVQAAERRRGLRCGGAGGAALWRSCPSLQDALQAEAEEDRKASPAAPGIVGAGAGAGLAEGRDPAVQLRFCADLLPLPTA